MLTTVKPNSAVVRSDDNRRTATVVALRDYDLETAPGMFLINTGTFDSPWFSYGMLTGRTRMRWGMACPTIVRFEVDTVVRTIDIDGVPTSSIVGVPGKRMPGIWITRPENVLTIQGNTTTCGMVTE